jgi:predicted porin
LNSSPNNFTGIFSGGVSMSRWGIKAETDLGNGMKGFLKLESAIDVNTGTTSNNSQSIANNTGTLTTASGASAIDGQAFSRAAYVGMSDTTFGSIQIGRTTNFSLDQVAQYDPVQNALLFSPLGFSGGIGGGLGATENTRLDNSIKYENKISNVDVGFQYQFTCNQTDQTAGSAYVAMLGYSDGPFSMKGTYAKTMNTVAWATQYSNVAAPASNLQIENTSGYMLSAMYKISPEATAKIGYEFAAVTAPDNPNLTGIQSYYGLTTTAAAKNVAASGEQDFGTFWIGGDYKITQAFNLAVAYYRINTYHINDIGKDYLANVYSILADYNFNKYFDTYAGAMFLNYSGEGLADPVKPVVYSYSSNAMYGAGLRFKF